MNLFLFTGLLLIIAIYSGRFFHKLKLPVITGYIIIGFLLGNIPFLSSHLNPYFSRIAIYVDELALAVISFEMGMEFKIRNLLEIEKEIFIITLVQGLFTYAVLFLGFKFILHATTPVALIVSSIGIATAPDVVILMLRETNSKNKLAKYLRGIVTLDDLLTEIIFIATIPFVEKLIISSPNHMDKFPTFVLMREFALSIVIAFVLGIIFALISKEFHKLRSLFAITLGLIFVSIGIGLLLKIHMIFLLLLTGIVYTNLTDKQNAMSAILSQMDAPLFILFLIVNGSALSFKLMVASGIFGIGFIALRTFGKVTGSYISGFFIKNKISSQIGWALLPQSEISIYLAILAKAAIPKYGNSVFSIAMSGVIFFELLGVPLLRYILFQSQKRK